MIRLFVAVPVPHAIRDILHEMGRSLPGGRAVAADQIHMTLRFIGEVEGGVFKDIRDELATVDISAFRVAIRGVGHFPPRGKPRVLWAGVDPADQVIRLKRRIDTALLRCGIAPDSRKFSPHVTIARLSDTPLARVTRFLSGNAFLQFDPFDVDRFDLYSSRLTPKGAIHTLERSYTLSAA